MTGQIPVYQDQPFWMFPFLPPSSNASDTTMLLIRVSIVLVAVGGILVLATSRRKRNHASH